MWKFCYSIRYLWKFVFVYTLPVYTNVIRTPVLICFSETNSRQNKNRQKYKTF